MSLALTYYRPRQLIQKKQQDFYRILHEIADRTQPRVRREFLGAIERLRGRVKLAKLEQAVLAGDALRVAQVLGLETLDRELQPLINELRDIFSTAAIASQQVLPTAVQAQISFDLLNPESVHYLQNARFELVGQITKTTEAGVRQIVLDAFERGGHPRVQARRIRDLIGLTPRQGIALQNYRALLESERRKPSQVESLAERYRKRLLTQRATNIARTETIRASNAGQQELWRQAAEQGLVDMQTAKRKWIVTPDDRLCPICKAIPAMNKEGAAINQSFQTPIGLVQSPPAHPSCRCAMGLIAF